jgi:GntR family transcriptional regulator/MocR family aminotransferase
METSFLHRLDANEQSEYSKILVIKIWPDLIKCFDQMKSLNIRLSKKKKPLHLKVADAIRNAIFDGQIRPNEKLPSTRMLAQQLRTHRQTIMAGFDELVAEGWIVALPRKGYLVADNPSLGFVSKKSDKRAAPVAQFQWQWSKTVDIAPFQPDSPIKYNFQSGLPDLNLFPRSEFHYHLSRAIKKGSNSLLDYSPPAGIRPLTDAIDTCLRRMKNITERTTLITNGSQEAIYIATQLMVRSGDHVAIEDPGYPPVRELLKSLGAKTVPLPLDHEGIIPEKLHSLAKKIKFRLLFLTPLHQFPTTVTLSAPRRLQIYEIARQHDIAIIEDDYDHEFHYRNQPLAPMASEDIYGRIIYLGTLSKIMFPAARLGFMSVPNSFAKNFLQYRRLITHSNEALLQQAVASWILDGGFERHLHRMRRVYEKRLLATEESLRTLQAEGKNISWTKPSGGMAVWLNTGMNSSKLAQEALSKKIFVTPEQYYRCDGKPGTHLRIGFSNQSESDIKSGIAELGKIIRA